MAYVRRGVMAKVSSRGISGYRSYGMKGLGWMGADAPASEHKPLTRETAKPGALVYWIPDKAPGGTFTFIGTDNDGNGIFFSHNEDVNDVAADFKNFGAMFTHDGNGKFIVQNPPWASISLWDTDWNGEQELSITPVKLGDKGADVEIVEEWLWENGLMDKKHANGVFDATDVAALVSYQKGIGIPSTGIFDQATWNTIYPKMSVVAPGAVTTARKPSAHPTQDKKAKKLSWVAIAGYSALGVGSLLALAYGYKWYKQRQEAQASPYARFGRFA